jgi:hypothetical protein
VRRLLGSVRRAVRRALGLDDDARRARQDLRALREEVRREMRASRRELRGVRRDLERGLVLQADQWLRERDARGDVRSLADAELRVFSQFGDDGILQHLIRRVEGVPRSFVEIGVQDYRESNTRFLLLHDDWRGLVVEADRDDVAAIRRQDVAWRHDLTVAETFVDAENVDALLAQHGFAGELGLLSLDVDGVDYWVWRAIACARPVLVVIEYNGLFGPHRALTVPYDPKFRRHEAHFSGAYYGASLGALARLGAEKGYALVGSNLAGVNAWFVRRDRLGGLREVPAAEAWVASPVRESRDASGALDFLDAGARLRAIAALPLVDVESGRTLGIGELAREGAFE